MKLQFFPYLGLVCFYTTIVVAYAPPYPPSITPPPSSESRSIYF